MKPRSVGFIIALIIMILNRYNLIPASSTNDTTDEIQLFDPPLWIMDMQDAGPGMSNAMGDSDLDASAVGTLSYQQDATIQEFQIDAEGTGYLEIAPDAKLPDVDTDWSVVGNVTIQGNPSYSGGQPLFCITEKNSTNWVALILTSKTNLQLIGRLRNSGGSAWANFTIPDVEDGNNRAFGISYEETGTEAGTYRVYWQGTEVMSASKSSMPIDTTSTIIGAYYNNALRDYGDIAYGRYTFYHDKVLSGQAFSDYANVVDGVAEGRFPNLPS